MSLKCHMSESKLPIRKGHFLVGQYKKKEEEEREIRVFKPQILLSSLSNALLELCYHPSFNFYAIPWMSKSQKANQLALNFNDAQRRKMSGRGGWKVLDKS